MEREKNAGKTKCLVLHPHVHPDDHFWSCLFLPCQAPAQLWCIQHKGGMMPFSWAIVKCES